MKTKKKVHWTQTAKGRKHMRDLAASRHAEKKETHHGKNGAGPQDFQVSYVFGSVERFIQIYEDGQGLARGSVAQRVGELLQHGSSRPASGPTKRLPTLRNGTT